MKEVEKVRGWEKRGERSKEINKKARKFVSPACSGGMIDRF